jgi:hypothetical protein
MHARALITPSNHNNLIQYIGKDENISKLRLFFKDVRDIRTNKDEIGLNLH